METERRGRGNPNIKYLGFKPGQSGNPNGRPLKLKIPPLNEILANVLNAPYSDDKTKAEALLDKLMEMAMGGDVRAAEMLLDRGYGKPKQSLEVAGEIHTTPDITLILPPNLNIIFPSNVEGLDDRTEDAELIQNDKEA